MRFRHDWSSLGLGRQIENTVAATALLALGLLPVLELALRNLFSTGIPGTAGYVQSLTLWVGFLGAMIASREHRHLRLATSVPILGPQLQGVVSVLVAIVGTMVAASLFWASLQFVWAETQSTEQIGGWLPIWVVEAIMPASFGVIALRFVYHVGGWKKRGLAFLGIPAAAAVGFLLAPQAPHLVWPLIAILVASAALGVPIFVVLGGIALLLFFADAVPVAAIPVATYRIAVSPLIPTIPLFTLAGYLLAEGGSRQRIIRLFLALFGWMPGGLAIAVTLVCAFFTTFTGASGVVILALGGLLLPMLLQGGYPERFSTGLLTSTGSIGLLLPPSIALILYAVVAQVAIPDLFMAGLIPGILMVAGVGIFASWKGVRARVARPRFDVREAAAAMWQSKWELMVPVIVILGIFGGYTTLTEAAAVTVIYILIVETLIHRDLHLVRDVPQILVKCGALVGGIFIILGVAFGLANYFVDADVPAAVAGWVQAHIESRILFLLVLNLLLIIVGCLMDIFSAMVVVVPLILPISQVYGIHPLHLGVIFLANLELGYLTPPVGMNLFMAAFRFNKSVAEVSRSVLPFILVLLAVVLLITYVPWLTTGLTSR